MKGYNKIRWYHRLWDALAGVYVWFKHGVTGSLLEERIATAQSEARNEGQEAVDKVVLETDIVPDCVSASVVRGGPCILVKTDGEWEAFIHNTFGEAADKAIEWVNQQGEYMESQAETSSMNRGQRRAFDAKRRLKRGGPPGKNRVRH